MIDHLVSGSWNFKVTAFEWQDDTPVYRYGKPYGGKAIGEGSGSGLVRSGLATPIEVFLFPYTGANDGAVVAYLLKLKFDWSFESQELRNSLNDVSLDVTITGPGGSSHGFIYVPSAVECRDGVVLQNVPLTNPGSYSIFVEMFNGGALLSRRYEAAYVTGNVPTYAPLKLYLNGGREDFTLIDGIPDPIDLSILAVVYDIDTDSFSVETDITDDAELRVGTNSLVLLVGGSPTGPIDFCDWYFPINHTGNPPALNAWGIENPFLWFETEVLAQGGDLSDLDAALAGAGVDPAAVIAAFEPVYTGDPTYGKYHGAILYTTDELTVFDINEYRAYTPGTWPMSFDVWTVDFGTVLYSMSDVNVVVE